MLLLRSDWKLPNLNNVNRNDGPSMLRFTFFFSKIWKIAAKRVSLPRKRKQSFCHII